MVFSSFKKYRHFTQHRGIYNRIVHLLLSLLVRALMPEITTIAKKISREQNGADRRRQAHLPKKSSDYELLSSLLLQVWGDRKNIKLGQPEIKELATFQNFWMWPEILIESIFKNYIFSSIHSSEAGFRFAMFYTEMVIIDGVEMVLMIIFPQSF